MSSEKGDKDNAENWGTSIGIFVAGVVVGAAGTAAVGHLTGRVNLTPGSTSAPATKPA
ncbi:hypothetical protein [Myxococcus llanfairpwllgwyngyllgogerychwyrndrobwllllantysiliogogogochensis]|uniref:hypothetical protein n=1 Tax=Myxococcus llanfairpwllgwyngyllgogerychwyrndrobwllllantysiliogogogochensis TaxID=2590453 RepID=UPI0015F05689|nr:hypothetical protein [Myxococcus llanfairpwllgwyngyllgogerychwyrndrobwllllantysiliogogogochensis]